MKSRWLEKSAILVLAIAGALSIGAMAQTTEPGPGPTEQPDAPMEIGEIGQTQGPESQPYDNQDQDSDAQPTEAQPGGPSGEAPAATDQGVARVSLIHGDVSTQRGDSGDWSAAALNQPVMSGDKISTADNARSEVQLDFANTLRLAGNSKANISNLTQKNIQIQLAEGLATYTVSKDSETEPEIDTPNVSIHPSHHDGVFRIEVHPDGDTIVIVRKGEAQIATPQGSTEIREGEMATVRGTADQAQYKISSASDRDDWDRWNNDRDHLIRDANSWRHTNRYYTGSQDLDAYGHWRHVDDYGDVWYPNESSDWAPYRNGNWVYEPYYGWTWVGYEPWGWAPYHYGRWLFNDGAWGWWPGPVYSYYRPFWSPAYVSFFGWGGGWGFNVGFGGWGGFGWMPLGPCDYFHPWWGGYRGRFGWAGRGFEGGRFGGIRPLHNGMRFSNLANLHNQRIGRAMSTVNAGHFGAGRIRAVAATSQQLRGARMMAGNLPVVPSRASLSASGRAASTATMRSGAQRFYGAHNTVSRPASFQQQTASLRQTMQQNRVGAIPAGGRSNVAFGRGANAVGTMQRPSAGMANRPTSSFGNRNNASQSENRSGYRPFNGNAANSREPQRGTSQPSAGENRGGFRTFNPPTGNSRSMQGNSASRGEPQRGTMQSAPPQNRGGFRPFTPPSRSEMSRGGSTSTPSRGNSSGGYWNRTAPSSGSQRGYSEGSGRGASRPQLDMRQPIVRSPSYGNGYPRGGYNAPSYGGSRGVPSYGGSRPSYGGSHASPSYGGSHASPSYGGGGRAPSGGGGHFGGGGGGRPSGGGGGHSSGGGGGHSGGGSHSGGGGHSGHH